MFIKKFNFNKHITVCPAVNVALYFARRTFDDSCTRLMRVLRTHHLPVVKVLSNEFPFINIRRFCNAGCVRCDVIYRAPFSVQSRPKKSDAVRSSVRFRIVTTIYVSYYDEYKYRIRIVIELFETFVVEHI